MPRAGTVHRASRPSRDSPAGKRVARGGFGVACVTRRFGAAGCDGALINSVICDDSRLRLGLAPLDHLIPGYARHPFAVCCVVEGYRGYSKLRTRTAIGSYSRDSPRSIGPP